MSYSHRDKDLVVGFTRLLRKAEAEVFRDLDNIPLGKYWRLAIEQALLYADIVLVFWSSASAASEEVRREYQQAIANAKDVIPVLLDGTPLAPQLSAYQYLDFRMNAQAVVSKGKRGSYLFYLSRQSIYDIHEALAPYARPWETADPALPSPSLEEHRELFELFSLIRKVAKKSAGQ